MQYHHQQQFITQLSTSGNGSIASFDVTRVGSALVRQLEEITGTIEAIDLLELLLIVLTLIILLQREILLLT